MQLIAASYHNIGPFLHTKLRITYHNGTYLINAPIGSGKSFLFFDALVYGLYKYKTRNILNNRADTGRIEIMFIADDVCYLLCRDLYTSSSGNTLSKNAILATVTDYHTVLQNTPSSVVTHETSSLREQYGHLLSIHETANDSQLQEYLLSILPLREVFLHTRCMMQGAPNFFAQNNADRIEIFKEIFGLLGIDHAKETINDYKKELRAQHKLLNDMHLEEKELQKIIHTTIGVWRTITENNNIAHSIPGYHIIHERFNDITILQDGVSLATFRPTDSIIDTINNVRQHLIGLQHDAQEKKGRLKTINENIMSLNQQCTQQENECKALQQQITAIEQTAQHNIHRRKELTTQIATLQTQHKTLYDSIPWDTVKEFGYTAQKTYEQLGIWLQERIHEGTLASQQHTSYMQQRDTLIQRADEYELNEGTPAYNRLIDAQNQALSQIESNLSSMKHTYNDLQKRQKKLDARKNTLYNQYNEIEKHLHEVGSTHCTLDHTHCPVLKDLQSSSTKQLIAQRDGHMTDIAHIETDISGLQEQITQLDYQKTYDSLMQRRTQLINDPQSALPEVVEQIAKEKKTILADYDNQLTSLNSAITQLEHTLTQQRKLFDAINRSQLRQTLSTLSSLDTQIAQQHDELICLGDTDTSQQLAHLQATLTSLKKQYTTLRKQRDTLLTQQSQLTQTINTTTNYTNLIDNIDTLIQSMRDIMTLIQRYHKKIQERDRIGQELTLVTNLYAIFSKELLFYVLASFLGTLENVINSYISPILGCTLNMNVDTTTSGKIDMTITITDTMGTRPVQSLSGGQMTVLKLAWMFAIAHIDKASFLFLDETINNMDISTITQVAAMVEQFASTHNMSLYIVTHSPDIHGLPIRDDIISLEGLQATQNTITMSA